MKHSKRTLIVHETPLQGFINDAVTYSFLAAMFWINVNYLDKAIPTWFLSFMALMLMVGKAMAFFTGYRVHHTDADSACAAIREFYEPSGAHIEDKP